jgi:hypothetical protein
MLEAESNPSIRVIENDNKESFDVCACALIARRPGFNCSALQVRGRGELQLGILIEEMRREKCVFRLSLDRLAHAHRASCCSLEFSVFPPKVVFRKGEKGEVGMHACLLCT